MKLAEALIERSDLQKRLSLLEGRLKRSSRVQEGDEPPESPRYLLTELDVLSKSLEDLIRRINRTNVLTAINSGKCQRSCRLEGGTTNETGKRKEALDS